MRRATSRLSWEIIASLWLHFIVAAVLVLFDKCAPPSPEPLFKPNEVMTVQIASAPRLQAARTQRAERAPDPVTAPTPEPVPEPTPAPTPPPTTSADMVLQQEEDTPDPVETPEPEPVPEPPPDEPAPPPAQEEPPDNSQDRLALLEQMREGEVSPDAPLGTTDRQEASPDGVEGASANPIGIGEADPVLAAYILACREAILPNWTPLPSLIAEHPEYEVIVQVSVDRDGSLGSPKIVRGSGDASFDRTAIMAVIKTRKLPPPPDAWAPSAENGVQIRLAAKDK
jgi:TonB family protein